MFKNSNDFEWAVTGARSSGRELVKKFWIEEANFNLDVGNLVRKPGPEYPDTRIGKLLFCVLKNKLDRVGINTQGLVLRSGVDTKADARHWSDLVLYIPAIPTLPATFDLFNISSDDVRAFREKWFDLTDRPYSKLDFNSDLFMFNRGLFAWIKQNKIPSGLYVFQNLGKWRKHIPKLIGNYLLFTQEIDFRQYTDRKRPENHFILTPEDVETPGGRKEFAKMVARYFEEVSKKSGCQNLALLSP